MVSRFSEEVSKSEFINKMRKVVIRKVVMMKMFQRKILPLKGKKKNLCIKSSPGPISQY
jgi:hypothetical protein